MRKIKFRAWDKKKKEMRVVGICEGKPFPIEDSTSCNLCLPGWEDIDAELSDPMQFTGLRDKNGKEIYEGDIIFVYWHGDEPKATEVFWFEDMGGWAVKDAKNEKWIALSSMLIGPGAGKFEKKVIGNIYENPDLLKESK